MPALAEKENTLVSQLEKTLRSRASHLAIKSTSSELTYADLDNLSARCAGVLQNKLENRFAPIALMMSHDVHLIAAMVGILRSGGFYFVLNRSLPPTRLREIVKEVRPWAIVADSEHAEQARKLSGSAANFFLFDDLGQGGLSSFAPANENSPVAIFYTSGSSQRPRPLVYTHGGTWHNLMNHSRSLRITADDRMTLLSPSSAAASVSAIFGALLNGAVLCPFNPLHEGLSKMRSWINNEQITVYHSVPSLFRRFAETLPPGEILRSVRVVKLGGEPVFASDVDLFRQHFRRDCLLINGLGLTEANGNACHFEVKADTKIRTATVPVGKPLEGIEMTLFAADGTEAPCGETGEIALRGKHTTPGFWTGSRVERYGPRGQEWFRTGDLGRRDSQGFFEHLGRKDDQLKLHGHWISVAEIEGVLMRIPGIREAAVLVAERSEHEKRIGAFVSWSNGAALPEPQLRFLLQQQLPSYSLPHYFFTLPELPLLPNGKIDRVSLSQKAARTLADRQTSRPDPTDPLVLQLVRIWQKALENDAIAPTDDFFALGGDSLAAATMLAAVEKFFGVDLPTSSLLEASTIEKMAEIIRKGGWSEAQLRLVGLQLCGNKPPLYCVPGAGADALALRELAAHLGNDRPFFAFQPQGLDGRTPYLRTVEEMAAHYIDSLRQHQPRGPYYLCGTSFGGVIAFEMARRLAEDGEEVKLLALLDSYAGEYPKRKKHLPVTKQLKLVLRRFLPMRHEGAVTLRALRKGLKERFQRGLIDLDLRLNLRKRPRPYRLRFLYLQEVCFAARRRHVLRPFPGKIDLFRMEHQPSAELFEHDPLLGWGGMAAKGIDVHELPGYHGQHLRRPNVTFLAPKLEACLRRAGGEAQNVEQPRSKFPIRTR